MVDSIQNSHFSSAQLDKHIKSGLFKKSYSSYDDFKTSLFGKTELFSHSKKAAGAEKTQQSEPSRADKFNDWGSGKMGNADFSLFDCNEVNVSNPNELSSYLEKLKDFSQEFVNKFDTDGDGKFNKEEFIKMASGGEEIDEETKKRFGNMFSSMNEFNDEDKDKNTMNAGEFSQFLAMADNLDSKQDGKLSLENYNNVFGAFYNQD